MDSYFTDVLDVSLSHGCLSPESLALDPSVITADWVWSLDGDFSTLLSPGASSNPLCCDGYSMTPPPFFPTSLTAATMPTQGMMSSSPIDRTLFDNANASASPTGISPHDSSPAEDGGLTPTTSPSPSEKKCQTSKLSSARSRRASKAKQSGRAGKPPAARRGSQDKKHMPSHKSPHANTPSSPGVAQLRTAARRSGAQASSPASDSDPELLSRRRNHNGIEKRYRNRLNQQFERLLAVLPAECRKAALNPQDAAEGSASDGEDRRLSKAEVLDMARQRICDLEMREQEAMRAARDTTRHVGLLRAC